MDDTVVCPACGNENAFFSVLDENGAHYECPDCDNEWCDSSVQMENESEDDDSDGI
jgi:transposase-like protein